jgi:acetyl/propionyl-CoA carboxylase alpha subunit
VAPHNPDLAARVAPAGAPARGAAVRAVLDSEGQRLAQGVLLALAATAAQEAAVRARLDSRVRAVLDSEGQQLAQGALLALAAAALRAARPQAAKAA